MVGTHGMGNVLHYDIEAPGDERDIATLRVDGMYEFPGSSSESNGLLHVVEHRHWETLEQCDSRSQRLREVQLTAHRGLGDRANMVCNASVRGDELDNLLLDHRAVDIHDDKYGCDTEGHAGRLPNGAVAASRRLRRMVIEFAGVTVVRGGAAILEDVDWTVAEGDRWVVLGPNGAGKTTLLALAATLLHPTRGVASVLEELLGLTDVFELRPRIGLASAVLAQQLPESERVLDVVRTGAYAMLGTWREEYEELDAARAVALLESWGAARLVDRTFGTLSEGERKRVQIARAQMPDPELLLLDEPAAGLDLGGREDLVGRLGALATDPAAATLVLVTHHVEEIPVGITHALLLRDGHVVSSGPIAQSLTSASLSATFGIELELEQRPARDGIRYSAHAATR